MDDIEGDDDLEDDEDVHVNVKDYRGGNLNWSHAMSSYKPSSCISPISNHPYKIIKLFRNDDDAAVEEETTF